MEYHSVRLDRLILPHSDDCIDRNEILKLSKNISQYGVLVPITVKRIGNTDKYEIISGKNRYYAAKIAKLNTIPAIEVYTQSDITELIIKKAKKQDIFSEAETIKRVISNNELTIEEFAEQTGYDEREVLLLLRLTKLNEFEREMIRRNNLYYETAAEIAVIDDVCKRTELLAEAIKLRLTPTEARRMRESERKGKRSPKYLNSPILKDIRLFDNTITRAISVLNEAGVGAEVKTEKVNGFTEYKIKIKA